eukprot:2757885-Pleurochrysis_carterae.AAC.4
MESAAAQAAAELDPDNSAKPMQRRNAPNKPPAMSHQHLHQPLEPSGRKAAPKVLPSTQGSAPGTANGLSRIRPISASEVLKSWLHRNKRPHKNHATNCFMLCLPQHLKRL